jgi:hypothetical protein
MGHHRLACLAALFAGCFAIPSPALAQTPSISEETRSTALKWELAYLAVSAIDTAQTVDCLDRGICNEANPLFGKHPSAKKLILAKAGMGLLHFAVFSRLNGHNPKAALRLAQISFAVQGTVVGLNARFTFR